jgi:hypothetical protein
MHTRRNALLPGTSLLPSLDVAKEQKCMISVCTS